MQSQYRAPTLLAPYCDPAWNQGSSRKSCEIRDNSLFLTHSCQTTIWCSRCATIRRQPLKACRMSYPRQSIEATQPRSSRTTPLARFSYETSTISILLECALALRKCAQFAPVACRFGPVTRNGICRYPGISILQFLLHSFVSSFSSSSSSFIAIG